MSRILIKEKAKQQLGNNIFGNNWMLALAACFVVSSATALAGVLIPGLGALIVSGPLSFGLAYIFLKQSRDGQPIGFEDIFKGFTQDFGQTFLICLMSTIFIFLWSLLFVIPGIVKTYSYSMAYYIKSDHPEYDWNQCITQSRILMNGHKFELFILDLSFIGWYFVGTLCLGIGTLWVVPYHQASRTQFYREIAEGNNDGNVRLNGV